MGISEQNKQAITALCENHCVKLMHVFGSVLSDRYTPQSDIDFLVQFTNINLTNYFDNYMDLKEKLENLLKKEVDLVENQTIKNPVLRKSIDKEKVLIYERKDIKVPV